MFVLKTDIVLFDRHRYSLKIESVSSENDVNTPVQETSDSSDGQVSQPELIGDYSLTKFLGRGNYGMVKMGVHKDTKASIWLRTHLCSMLRCVAI